MGAPFTWAPYDPRTGVLLQIRPKELTGAGPPKCDFHLGP